MIPDRRVALAGEAYEFEGRQYVVQPKPESATDNGGWFCCSCAVGMRSNIEKDSHCHKRAPRRSALRIVKGEPARHVLAWLSFDSGNPEEP